MGDSYAASAGQLPTSLAGNGLACSRSLHDYPAVVANGLGLSAGSGFTDVSCSGAATGGVLREQTNAGIGQTEPPQIDAVTPDTDLVTVTVGGNDGSKGGFFLNAILVCNTLGAFDPFGSPCQDRGGQKSEVLTGEGIANLASQVQGAIAQIAAAVRQRSPRAEILVVGYPKIFPHGARCVQSAALTNGDLVWLDQIVRRLNAALQAGAADGGARYVDVYAASEGHDMCSGQAWVAGALPAPGAAQPWHPISAGTQGIGETVLAALGR